VYLASVIRAAMSEFRTMLRAGTPTHARLRDTLTVLLVATMGIGARILDIGMEAYAITVVATLAGSIGAFLIRRAREADEAAADRHGPARAARTE